jgi:hypothetical protein
MSGVKENEKEVGVSRQQKDKQTLPREGGEEEARTHLFEDVYLIFYGPAVVPNVRSLMHSGQQICSRESGQAATDDSNFDASTHRVCGLGSARSLICARRKGRQKRFILLPLNGNKGNLEGHGDTDLHRKA